MNLEDNPSTKDLTGTAKTTADGERSKTRRRISRYAQIEVVIREFAAENIKCLAQPGQSLLAVASDGRRLFGVQKRPKFPIRAPSR